LAQSRNIPAIKVLYLAGITDSIKTAEKMGITSLGDKNQYGLTLVLGGGEVSPLDITSAYGVFANEGIRNPYVSILKIENTKGEILEEINKQLLLTSEFLDFSNKYNEANNIKKDEEEQVKLFINTKYIIDNDVNHKMKASTLYDSVIDSSLIFIDNNNLAGFRIRLSKYLKELGLQKKRYNDGVYYYGILEKNNISQKIMEDMEKIMNERTQEIIH
jgi:membrane carboxypeptidase/penicillin-binding protein